MNTTRKSLAFAGTVAIACMVLCASTARAQGFSFGYSGPGGSVGVTTGNYWLLWRWLLRRRLLWRRISGAGTRRIRAPARSPLPTCARPSSWEARSSSPAPTSSPGLTQDIASRSRLLFRRGWR